MRTYQTLPVDSFLPELIQLLESHSNVILVAEPGAGKTTRVPVAASKVSDSGKWIVLQPRRWAAKLSAARIAEEQGWSLGKEVGYQVRFDSRVSKDTRITFMTEGVLLRKLIGDPELSGYAGVILDEFHERSLDLDLSLAMLKEIQQSLRPELKMIVMSATLDAAPLAKFLETTAVLNIPGRVFPVKKIYLGEVSERGMSGAYRAQATASFIEEAITIAENQGIRDGDILVFLPGAYEIDSVVRELRSRWLALPLYANLPESEQKKVFESSTKRRIICATNIAETSLTLPNVRIVVDSGWGKVSRLDPQFGQSRLETLRISKASSEQRAGRAGRVSEGICFRLWSEGEQSQLRHFETPEIHRVHLGQALMMLSEYGVREFSAFDWFEKPKASMLEFAVRELEQLGLMLNGALTPEGKLALELPLAPRLAKLILVAKKEGVPEFGARVAAFLEGRAGQGKIAHWEDWIPHLNRLTGAAKMTSERLYGQALVPSLKLTHKKQFEKVLLESLSSQVFMAGSDLSSGLLVGRRKVVGGQEPLPRVGILIHSVEKTQQGVPFVEARAWVDLSSESLVPYVEAKTRVFYDEKQDRVRAVEGKYFRDLSVGHETEKAADANQVVPILMGWIRDHENTVLNLIKKINPSWCGWRERAVFFNSIRKESESKIELQDWSWIESAVWGETRIASVLEKNLVPIIEGGVDSVLLREFKNWIPEKIEVPSGSQISVEYAEGQKPKLSVRLQEVFGWKESPVLAQGRVSILLELLSPGFKPIQLTQDLASFWKSTYFEVRKELKSRYPKHAWPEDPLTAQAVAKGRPRR